MSDVFTALQATLGGIYVNNFNLYGRTWQVNVQGEASNRGDIPDIWQIYVRNNTGQMVPIRSIASLKIVTGPQVITRYNNYRSITVNGSPAAGCLVRIGARRHGEGVRGNAAGRLRL